eukprot:259810-Chlamydomonas_euryale.AAC.4
MGSVDCCKRRATATDLAARLVAKPGAPARGCGGARTVRTREASGVASPTQLRTASPAEPSLHVASAASRLRGARLTFPAAPPLRRPRADSWPRRSGAARDGALPRQHAARRTGLGPPAACPEAAPAGFKHGRRDRRRHDARPGPSSLAAACPGMDAVDARGVAEQDGRAGHRNGGEPALWHSGKGGGANRQPASSGCREGD